jgi:HPr kinase/phosphorylase
MQVYGSCAGRDGDGILFLGPPGAGKSDMVLRLIDRGFSLVADDRVEIEDGFARPAAGLAGLLEVRGLGIMRLPHVAPVQLRLAVTLGPERERLPSPARYAPAAIPAVTLDPAGASAAARAALALACLRGEVAQLAGAFA